MTAWNEPAYAQHTFYTFIIVPCKKISIEILCLEYKYFKLAPIYLENQSESNSTGTQHMPQRACTTLVGQVLQPKRLNIKCKSKDFFDRASPCFVSVLLSYSMQQQPMKSQNTSLMGSTSYQLYLNNSAKRFVRRN